MVLLQSDRDFYGPTINTLYPLVLFLYNRAFVINCKTRPWVVFFFQLKEPTLFYLHSRQNSSPIMTHLCMCDYTGIWTWSCMYKSLNMCLTMLGCHETCHMVIVSCPDCVCVCVNIHTLIIIWHYIHDCISSCGFSWGMHTCIHLCNVFWGNCAYMFIH